MESRNKDKEFLTNPYAENEGYHCFGCAPHNPVGLRMKFYRKGEGVECFWQPSEPYQGWQGILHGGIQATLIDETASWLLYSKNKPLNVTTKMEIRYKRPVPMDKGPVRIAATLKEIRRNIAFIDVKLYCPEDQLCTEAHVSFFCDSKR
ncbi:MAG: PaaI family thioesterase [Bacteroidetes bacterium]|nr:PaaI family thioesterase [Bacteroidota bacterium]